MQCEQIASTVQQYEIIVQRLMDGQQFVRFFGGTRIRRRLDITNAQLDRQIQAIWSEMAAYVPVWCYLLVLFALRAFFQLVTLLTSLASYGAPWDFMLGKSFSLNLFARLPPS